MELAHKTHAQVRKARTTTGHADHSPPRGLMEARTKATAPDHRRKGHHRPRTDTKKDGKGHRKHKGRKHRPTGHRPQARRRTTGHTEGRKARTQARTMEKTQLKLNFDRPQGEPGQGPRTRREVHSPHLKTSGHKEELLLTHYRQGKTTYCALYALAMLEGLDPKYIIKIAKKTVSGTRTRYRGLFWQVRNTYCNLGYHFPFGKIPDPDTQRTRDLDIGQFSGKGHIRIQKRRASLKGHQACYKNGIVYDSSELGPQAARLYLTNLIKKRYHYIVIKPQQTV